MKYIIILLFILFSINIFCQNIGSGSYNPTELMNEVGIILNNLKESHKIKKDIRNNKSIKMTELKDPVVETLSSLLYYSVDNNNFEASKIILKYYTENNYNTYLISSIKTTAMKKILIKNRLLINISKNVYIYSYDIDTIKIFGEILIDKNTNLQILFEEVYNAKSYVAFGTAKIVNAHDVLHLLRTCKYN